MRLLKISLFTLGLGLAVSGCSESILPNIPRPSVPFVHKIDVQQGNVITQQMVAQLRLGMDKKKVRFVMGTPIIQDTFHSNRWDYVYTFHEGGARVDERRLITAIFNEDGNLVNLEGNITPALGRLEVDKHQDTSVEVPGAPEKGMLSKLKNVIPFTGDDEPSLADDEKSKKDDKDGEPSDNEKSTVADTGEEPADGDKKLFVDDESEKFAKEEAARIAEAEKTAVTVPGGAPPKKQKGFFQRLADSVGLGADDEDLEHDSAKDEALDYDPEDPKYQEQADPEAIGGDG
jgi:outer membrane protein assembly factor BamE